MDTNTEIVYTLRSIKTTLTAIALKMDALSMEPRTTRPGLTYHEPNEVTDPDKLPPRAKAKLNEWSRKCDEEMVIK